jgi:hypothetical protein
MRTRTLKRKECLTNSSGGDDRVKLTHNREVNLIDFEPQAGHDAEVWPCSTASQLTRTNVADDLAFGECESA